MLRCLIFEDAHLLVVNKPAGINTHAPSAYAGEGIYDWFRHREPRWASLAIIHRLDKETSGVILFAKSPLANRSLTEQFTHRAVRKKYLLLTDRPVSQSQFTVKSSLVRAGERYISRSSGVGGSEAETFFRILPSDFGFRTSDFPSCTLVEAEPLTGRTHQIRVHAGDNGFPILGDTLYGGTSAGRVFLHATELTMCHPATGTEMTFRAAPEFAADARLRLRSELIDPELTNAWRLIHSASDGWPGWYVDQLGEFLLSQSDQPLDGPPRQRLQDLMAAFPARGIYHKVLARQAGRAAPAPASPQLVAGEAAPDRFVIRENGLRFELSFKEGYSVGLFLDQRDNRRRLLVGCIAAEFPLLPGPSRPAGAATKNESRTKVEASESPTLLNCFAYTCGFSVGAAKAGFRTTSLDLSKKYLDWGRRNFELNEIATAGHDFIFGDTWDWLRRMAKHQRRFDVVLLDPPTFSQSKESGVFRVEKDLGRLVTAALGVLQPGGILFASANAHQWPAEDFLAAIEAAVHGAKRKIALRHYVPQPPDFPISRGAPGYLKTVWLKID